MPAGIYAMYNLAGILLGLIVEKRFFVSRRYCSELNRQIGICINEDYAHFVHDVRCYSLVAIPTTKNIIAKMTRISDAPPIQVFLPISTIAVKIDNSISIIPDNIIFVDFTLRSSHCLSKLARLIPVCKARRFQF